MKRVLFTLLCIISFSFSLLAQEIDTVPVSIQDMEIKLKKNPLPARPPGVKFEEVKLLPKTIDFKIRYWKTTTTVGINLNQSAFSENWKGGGVNSIALGGVVDCKAEYARQNHNYVSETNLQYGKIKNKNEQQKKTNDRIFLDNKAALQLSKNGYFFGSVTFESQFDKGFAYSKNAEGQEIKRLISGFMAPGYLTESFGFEYKPYRFFSLRIGTGMRQTFVLDTALYRTNPNNFGLNPGKRLKNELAFQVLTNFEKEVLPDLFAKVRYNIFIPYNQLGHMAHRIDLNITAKVNHIINVGLNGIGLFDRNQDAKFQASQSISLGVAFTFPR